MHIVKRSDYPNIEVKSVPPPLAAIVAKLWADGVCRRDFDNGDAMTSVLARAVKSGREVPSFEIMEAAVRAVILDYVEADQCGPFAPVERMGTDYGPDPALEAVANLAGVANPGVTLYPCKSLTKVLPGAVWARFGYGSGGASYFPLEDGRVLVVTGYPSVAPNMGIVNYLKDGVDRGDDIQGVTIWHHRWQE